MIAMSKTNRYSIINITNDEEVSVNQMVQAAFEVVGHETEVVNGEDRKGQIFKEQIKNSRLRELGWEPKVNFKEGMRLSFEYFK